MQARVFLLSLSLLTLLGSSVAQAHNLLTNPSFESGGSGPTGWSTWPPYLPGGSYTWSTTDPHTGQVATARDTVPFSGLKP